MYETNFPDYLGFDENPCYNYEGSRNAGSQRTQIVPMQKKSVG